MPSNFNTRRIQKYIPEKTRVSARDINDIVARLIRLENLSVGGGLQKNSSRTNTHISLNKVIHDFEYGFAAEDITAEDKLFNVRLSQQLQTDPDEDEGTFAYVEDDRGGTVLSSEETVSGVVVKARNLYRTIIRIGDKLRLWRYPRGVAEWIILPHYNPESWNVQLGGLFPNLIGDQLTSEIRLDNINAFGPIVTGGKDSFGIATRLLGEPNTMLEALRAGYYYFSIGYPLQITAVSGAGPDSPVNLGYTFTAPDGPLVYGYYNLNVAAHFIIDDDAALGNPFEEWSVRVDGGVGEIGLINVTAHLSFIKKLDADPDKNGIVLRVSVDDDEGLSLGTNVGNEHNPTVIHKPFSTGSMSIIRLYEGDLFG